LQKKIVKNDKTIMFDTIKRLSIRLLQDEVVLASWGISNVITDESSFRFSVNGFKYCGPVEIRAQDNGRYEILLGKDSQGIVDLDHIVGFLDNAIEKTGNYNQSIKEWIHEQLKG
jgi:hypothetical protein